MPEAEDVILEAAEHATAAVRAMWRRAHPREDAGASAFDARKRRLELVLAACVADPPPIVAADAPAAPRWIARGLGRLAPWALSPRAIPFTDGAHVFLPRIVERERVILDRLAALSLAMRVESGSVALCPAQPVARDLFWAADGARIDARIASELPGLAAAVGETRAAALLERPAESVLTAAERAVETIVRGLLGAPLDAAQAPERLSAWAAALAAEPRFAGRYRGMAPVAHWGVPRPDLATGSAPRARTEEEPRSGASRRVRRLARRVEARALHEDEENDRSGPFLVPFGDPPQTIEDPSGLRRPEDRGEDVDLDTLGEEIERLGELPRVRSATAVREILEDDGPRIVTAAPVPPAVDAAAIRYPEWDFRVNAYRAGHCLVRERAAAEGDPAWAGRVLGEQRALLEMLRRRFARLRPRRERRPRERDGDELDLDAFVDDFADRVAGRTPGDRLYLADRPLRRDVAVALLIDASGSTDAWVDGGRSVLEVEKQAALAFCESLAGLGDRHAIYAFSGRGPRDVRLHRVKGFTERYDATVQRRIAGVPGSAYTRLGAAIRHVTAALSRERARVRLLLLLSDGKPNDEDEYEGRHGIEDTRRAVAEARLAGASAFCVTIDRGGSSTLPYLFGPHGYTVAASVAELPLRLPEIYRGLTTRE